MFRRQMYGALGYGLVLVALTCALFAPPKYQRALAQGVLGIFQNGNPLAPSVSGIGDPSSGLYFGTGYLGVSRHFGGGSIATNNLPVLSNGGATPLLTAGSTDMAGSFSSTSGTTTLTMTFGSTYTTAPSCIVQEQGGVVGPTYTVSATAITITVLVAATKYNYVCFALNGG